MMSAYQKEQVDALETICDCLAKMSERERDDVKSLMVDYLSFRGKTDRFLETHFSEVCSESCYRNRLSACCSKDGIITFFADVVINAMHCTDNEINRVKKRLLRPHTGFKCVYLAEDGCLWRIKPIVCQMFLCEKAQAKVFGDRPAAREAWESLKQRKKTFAWPDRPVLFDRLEAIFIDAGCTSSLMYLHNSPGLLMVKRKAGLITP